MLNSLNHIESGLKRITSAYKDKPNFIALFTIILSELNDLESAIEQVKESHEILNAKGQSLEFIGRNVGAVKQNNVSDDEFRKSIFTKIGQNISKGEPETIKAIYRLLTGASRTQYSESKTGVSIYTDGEFDSIEINSLFRNIKSVVMGGKRVELLGKMHAESGFSFAGNLPGAGFDEGQLAYSKNINLPFRFFGTSDGAGFKNTNDIYSGGVLA